MTTLQRVSIALGCIALAVVLASIANRWLKPHVFGNLQLSQPAARHHATARIERVESTREATVLCYTLNTLEDLPAADRSFYETTEAAHTAGHGPRCMTTRAAAARSLSKDTLLDVEFTLGNGGKIAITRVSTAGQAL